MHVETVFQDSRINQPIAHFIVDEVSKALNKITTDSNFFTVNPTLWYWKNPKGEIKPSVVNSAAFLSSHFQNNLAAAEWTKEKSIKKQKIDAYIDFLPPEGLIQYALPEEQFLPLLELLRESNPNAYGLDATKIFNEYVLKRSSYLNPELVDHSNLFVKSVSTSPLRIGLEFETGNIASSFRALQKLDLLAAEDQIDIGVFVTSLNKSECATKIWPVSNRNGSFVELRERKYQEQRSYLAIDIGFAPDRLSESAPYLGENGETYLIAESSEPTLMDGIKYIEGKSHRGTVYRPI